MNNTSHTPNRWLIAGAGTLLQLCLGTVYAWSYFQKPLTDTYGWTNTQVAWIFSLAICFLGIAAAWGGTQLARIGPRRLAVTGAGLFAAGYVISAAALHFKSLALLYIGYGVIGGTGLGLGYVTPVATVAKWFPDKKGLATGMVIMGFGFGALLMSKVLAPDLLKWTGGNLVHVFFALGVVFAIVAVPVALYLRNPPTAPTGPSTADSAAAAASSAGDVRQCLLSRRFMLMWLVFFCNILAGISIIGFQSPLMQDLWKKINPQLTAGVLATYGATLIAVSSVFNGLGRMIWGAISDKLGRIWTFRIMLGSQVVVFCFLIKESNPWVFGAMVCYVLLCYGGGFGTMPAFVLDVFGGRMMALVYGVILTAWSAGGVVGPQLVAYVKDHFAARASAYSFTMSAAFLALGLVMSLLLNDKPFTHAGVKLDTKQAM